MTVSMGRRLWRRSRSSSALIPIASWSEEKRLPLSAAARSSRSPSVWRRSAAPSARARGPPPRHPSSRARTPSSAARASATMASRLETDRARFTADLARETPGDAMTSASSGGRRGHLLRYEQHQGADSPSDERQHDEPDDEMGHDMHPVLAIAAPAVLGRGVDVVRAGDDGQHDGQRHQGLREHALKQQQGQELLVAPEAARLDGHAVVHDAQEQDDGHAHPLRGGVRSAAQGKGQAHEKDQHDQGENDLLEAQVLGHGLAEHASSFASLAQRAAGTTGDSADHNSFRPIRQGPRATRGKAASRDYVIKSTQGMDRSLLEIRKDDGQAGMFFLTQPAD